jgi:type I restriction enzyme S subunit
MSRDWPTVRLGALLEVQNGYAFNSKQFAVIGGVPLIRIRDLKHALTTETNFIGAYDSRYEVRRGDLLVGMDGEFACYRWQGPTALLNQRVCRLHKFAETLLPDFLLYGINKYLKEIEDRTTYTTVKHLSARTIREILIPVPPLAEQKRIVTILDEVFAGINTAIANTQKNLANARELFDGYLSSVFNYPTEGWMERTLSELAVEFSRGKSKHRPRNDPKLFGGRYPFIQTGDIRQSHQFVRGASQFYNEFGLAQSKLWPKGTVCITIAANIAETAILGLEACFPDSVIGMVVDENQASNRFVEYLLRYMKATLQAEGKGSAQDNINLGTFEKARFPFPPLAEQHRIARELDAVAAAAQQLTRISQRKLSALAELKQSILQKAFAGELTAKNVERELAAA